MKVEVTMEMKLDLRDLEYETERGLEVALELLEEGIEGAIKNNLERSWGFSDWPAEGEPVIYVFAQSVEERLGPEAIQEGACDECGKWEELDQGLCPACVEAIN